MAKDLNWTTIKDEMDNKKEKDYLEISEGIDYKIRAIGKFYQFSKFVCKGSAIFIESPEDCTQTREVVNELIQEYNGFVSTQIGFYGFVETSNGEVLKRIEVPRSAIKQIALYSQKKGIEPGDIQKGFYFIINKKGKGLQTRWSSINDDFSVIDEAKVEQWKKKESLESYYASIAPNQIEKIINEKVNKK